MKGMIRTLATCALLAAGSVGSVMAKPAALDVTRATLHNGLRVFIVRDTLAPVVTTQVVPGSKLRLVLSQSIKRLQQ